MFGSDETRPGNLDIIEVVSRSMREFKVKVPRADLRKAATIDGFVDLLYRSWAQAPRGAES